MATPSFLNDILVLTPSNPTFTGTLNVRGFLVNSSATNWAAKVTDVNGQVVFYATHSGVNVLPFSHPISKDIQLRDLSMATSSNVDHLLIYTGW